VLYGPSIMGSLCDRCLGFIMCCLLYKLHAFNPTGCLCNTFACSELMSPDLNLSECLPQLHFGRRRGKEGLVGTICSIA